jgi:dihydroflavonol-4-reductase
MGRAGRGRRRRAGLGASDSEAESDSDTDAETDSESNADSDSDADTGTDADTDTGPKNRFDAVPNPCYPLPPFRGGPWVGQSRRAALPRAGSDGSDAVKSLVLGAGGFLGINLVDALLVAGWDIRCGRRKRSNVLALRERKVLLVQADLDSPEELSGAMAGREIVFHLAGHYPRLSLDREAALRTGLGQIDRVLDAAAAAGVQRLVYVSSTATVAKARDGESGEAGPSDERHVFPGMPGFGTYHDLKWAMEARALAERRLEVVVACPGGCLGPYDLRVGTSTLLVALARGMDPPHPDGWVSPVDARDVAQALVRLAAHPAPPRRVILAGPSMSLHALLSLVARRYGVREPSPTLLAEAARALADAEEERASREGGRPGLSREIVDLIVHGARIDAGLSKAALGLAYRPLDETLAAADDWNRRMRILPPLSHAAVLEGSRP